MIDVQLTLPPAEEFFNIPAQFVDECNLLGSEIETVGGHPIVNSFYRIFNQPDRFYGLIYIFGSQQYQGIEKHIGIGGRLVFFNNIDRSVVLDLPHKYI
ncbi:MAG: hypothetical protein HN580_28690 [Deltaproteobacteria bacterium]|nr:hypothetical protein [Deltaproteobacteria bacterium]MBT4640512.1 hypothetical protein [Deltaproteobacteria bacterium]MBT6502253.1 hypothetical protein [Deltaproteobacteria bacterium]MBT7153734.1 hypothetical protein [Deltaproteobacteria bacterium]MBT7893020.1 hypothetical protein [Deltaproteobacteria bacterium]